MKLNSYWLWYCIAILLFGILVVYASSVFPNYGFAQQDIFYCFLFYGICSPAIYLFTQLGFKTNKISTFLAYYYGSFGIKLLASVLFLGGFLLITHRKSFVLAGVFMAGILVFSIIETYWLMKRAKKVGNS